MRDLSFFTMGVLRSSRFDNGGEPNQITGANAGKRHGFAVKSRVVLRHRPGVAQFHR